MVLNYMTFFKLVFLTAACFFWSSCGGYHFAGKAVPPDLRGRYCSARSTVQCCPGRNDQCSVPILRTVCYCDTFCNRTVADCCPDFWGYCLNMDPPYGAMTFPPNHPPATKPTPLVPNNCHHEGRQYTLGDKIHWNCNNCWTASNYTFLWGLTLDEGIKYKLGTFRPDAFLRQMTPLRVPSNEILPETFDAREQWPWWVHGVVDQGNCGASWAFSTTSVAADRLAIHSLGALREELSTQHLLSCDTSVQKGCNGGYLDSAWWFMRRTGVVSKDCYPYKSGSTNSQGRCGVPKYRGPTSRAKCPGTDKYRSIIYKTTPPYRIAPLEREIMKEIMLNGPVQATMEVREDFFMYRGGVYQYSLPATTLPPNYRRTGFHSVRIIGWGKDKKAGRYGLKYWLCANSWGRHWGEDGYFRILKGADECKIESFVIGVWGRVLGKHIINKRQASTR